MQEKLQTDPQYTVLLLLLLLQFSSTDQLSQSYSSLGWDFPKINCWELLEQNFFPVTKLTKYLLDVSFVFKIWPLV